MDIKSARRKSFDVTYVIVTEENIEEVAAWCSGEIGGEGAERFVKVTDKNAISTRQAKAFFDDYVLKMSETGSSFKAFTEKAFMKSYDKIVASGEKLKDRVGPGASDREVARSAKSGKFVSKEEAKANPDTTVVEKIETPLSDDFVLKTFDTNPVILKGVDFAGETTVKLPDEGRPYYETDVNPEDESDVTTTYFNASGIEITRAEYESWGK